MTNDSCCSTPLIVNIAFHDDRINKFCRKCGSHWYGTAESVKRYTRQEWDAWVNSADESAPAREKANDEHMVVMTYEEIISALDKGLMACCADCGAKTPTPLPEGWVWDSPEAHWWAFCPSCPEKKTSRRPASQADAAPKELT